MLRSELCAAANVSERTLQYAFHDIMGMSPLTYLHRLRLHRARDELRKAKNGSTTVTDVAMNWGFWHFGEFSRAYKNCFGEVPSQTLKQAPGKLTQGLCVGSITDVVARPYSLLNLLAPSINRCQPATNEILNVLNWRSLDPASLFSVDL